GRDGRSLHLEWPRDRRVHPWCSADHAGKRRAVLLPGFSVLISGENPTSQRDTNRGGGPKGRLPLSYPKTDRSQGGSIDGAGLVAIVVSAMNGSSKCAEVPSGDG